MANKFKPVRNSSHSVARSCGVRCCKMFLVVVNFIFLLSGLTLLGLGIWMHFADSSSAYMQIIHDASCTECSKAIEYLRVPYVLMVTGGFVALLSFLGCCGAFSENTFFLCLYALLLVLILLAEIACSVLVIIYKQTITKCLECSMQHQVRLQYNQTEVPGVRPVDKHNQTSLITLAWDEMQVKLDCCGAMGPSDYFDSAWYNYTRRKSPAIVPPTCCKLKNKDHKRIQVINRRSCRSEAAKHRAGGLPVDDFLFLKGKGCHEAFLEWLERNLYIAILVLVGVTILQVLDTLAACLLLCRVRSERSHKPPSYHSAIY